MNIKKIPVSETALSARSKNALLRQGITTVGEMLEYDEERLNGIRNLGSKSVSEILYAIEEYRKALRDEESGADSTDLASDITAHQDFVREWLREKGVSVSELQYVPPKAYNLLIFNGYESLHQIVFSDAAKLMEIPRMDQFSAKSIVNACKDYLEANKSAMETDFTGKRKEKSLTADDLFSDDEYRETVLSFVRANDIPLQYLGLKNRAFNQLQKNGFTKLSEIIFMSRSDFNSLRSMGTDTVDNIIGKIEEYKTAHGASLLAFVKGDKEALMSDELIKNQLLRQFDGIGFRGLTFAQMKEGLQLPAITEDSRLKRLIGELISAGSIEYSDFRCYRVYGKFSEVLENFPAKEARSHDMLVRRLQGETLVSVAESYGLTRERVRQVVKKYFEKVRLRYTAQTGLQFFDEDYYRYLYENYDVNKKDAEQWFGIPEYVFRYFDALDVKKGSKDLASAPDDAEGLTAGMRLKIKNYIHRNQLYIDGIWVNIKRSELIEKVLKLFCQDEMSFTDFMSVYNGFLEKQGIAFSEELYITESTARTCINRVSDSRTVLWKQNEMLRYYDIDAYDFTELFEVLNLDAYEDVNISAYKFFRDFPEIMKKYDIRDYYELHNLLRKTVPEGSYHGFSCGKMPILKFGNFDRDGAIFNILKDNSPISMADVCRILQDEYGFNPAVVQSTYVLPFSEYYANGFFTLENKTMSEENMRALDSALSDGLYFFDEIRKIYKNIIPDGDTEEINPFNLKKMGYSVFSRYMLKGYASLDGFFEELLTKSETDDISPFKRRYGRIIMFLQKLLELKKTLDIIEFEPDRILNISRLEKAGITKEDLTEFSSAVADFVNDGEIFSIHSINRDGFDSPLYELGFSDWFYSNLLLSDSRFSYGNIFGNLLFVKGKTEITRKSFICDIIKQRKTVDTYDLMNEINEKFGCEISERSDLWYLVRGTQIYHDAILDRFYENEERYYRELDEKGGF